MSLDTLPAAEAAQLLARLAARPALDADDPAVAEMVRLCGYLPLAVGMLARQLHHHPAWTAADLAAELAAARDRLDLLHTENLSVAAAFSLSYEELTEDQQRLFRQLGLHPGADIDAYAAAALADTQLATVRRDLDALYDHYLIGEPARGRYRLHDLIREHARALAASDPSAEPDAAAGRLLDYYQHTAMLTSVLLARQTRPRTGPAVSAPPDVVPDVANRDRALAWIRAERANLLACLDHAADTGQHARVVAFTAALAEVLRRDGPWAEAIARHACAVQAARGLGDRPAEAAALNDQGHILGMSTDYPAASRALEEALAIYRELGDRLGQANVLTNLGLVSWSGLSDYPRGSQALQEALSIYRDLTDQLGQALSLRNLGAERYSSGDFPGAAAALEEALALARDLGDRLGEADTRIYLGSVLETTGDYPGASEMLAQALVIVRDLGDRHSDANTLLSLGYVHRATGDHPGATRLLAEALDIYRELGNRRSQAMALSEQGTVRRLAGDYPGAAGALGQAVGIYRGLGDRRGQAEALNETGTLRRIQGDLDRAQTCHRQALELARQIGSAWDEACALAGLGRCTLAAGDTGGARTHLAQALDIFQRIGAAEASSVAAELAALSSAEQAELPRT